ncbi:hypothetical protein GOBAR_AA14432 [Gossypium barbadense]|uniref:Thymidylate kinase-like domain-containing protein n=1 Tax=Gossypium barbadense TaxID=3634 RepID=A0A2P5XSF8_GOSBA|nr:hypothetical protein GOBAR_AA14432 [Gossypium barbadense]
MTHACTFRVSKSLGSRNFGVLAVRRSLNLGLNISCKRSVRSIRMENGNNCNLMGASNESRGALVVFEGLDRSGKTSQCGKLLSYLEGMGHSVELWRFPDRTTSVGQMISAYLTNKSQLDDHTIHLLFSANRWEKSHIGGRKNPLSCTDPSPISLCSYLGLLLGFAILHLSTSFAIFEVLASDLVIYVGACFFAIIAIIAKG